ncbi:hypothetical protein SAMN06265222_111162 [Neorhodopirellula lusitana]|uniref:Secreted protein n=1 Tax=Neorhodopirellula lusitana TaxID=445327 RepID=A0ABY1QEC0_9BACT|nr:hypothetical protein [Neorhodopirellula lusitana]SMP69035.1 hypothetical protein SAMN06265222_111162 [Neorhodopirellula lusitana]
MKKCLVVLMLFVGASVSGCGKPEPTVLQQDERQSLGELMASESAAAAEDEPTK